MTWERTLLVRHSPFWFLTLEVRYEKRASPLTLVQGCCPHGAGASHTDNWADPRESVEVRLLLIMENSMEAKATA